MTAVDKTLQPVYAAILRHMGTAAPGAGKRTPPSKRDREHGRTQCKHLQISLQGKTLGKEKRQAQITHIGFCMPEQRKIGIIQAAYNVRIAHIIKGIFPYNAIIPPGQVRDPGEPLIIFQGINKMQERFFTMPA